MSKKVGQGGEERVHLIPKKNRRGDNPSKRSRKTNVYPRGGNREVGITRLPEYRGRLLPETSYDETDTRNIQGIRKATPERRHKSFAFMRVAEGKADRRNRKWRERAAIGETKLNNTKIRKTTGGQEEEKGKVKQHELSKQKAILSILRGYEKEGAVCAFAYKRAHQQNRGEGKNRKKQFLRSGRVYRTTGERCWGDWGWHGHRRERQHRRRPENPMGEKIGKNAVRSRIRFGNRQQSRS